MATTDIIKELDNANSNLQVLRISVDAMIEQAQRHPRSLKVIRDSISEQLDVFPNYAAELIYSKPVGKEKATCNDCGAELGYGSYNKCGKCKGTNIRPGGQKITRGLSIRAAEMLAEAYGFNAIFSSVRENADGKSVTVSAMFLDYHSMRSWSDEGILSKYYKGQGGAMVRWADDRFYSVVCKAEASRRVREVVSRCVNPTLKAWLFSEADRRTEALLTDEGVHKIIEAFSTFGLDAASVYRVIGRENFSGLTMEDRKTLQGLWTGLKEGTLKTSELIYVDEGPERDDSESQEFQEQASRLLNPTLSKDQSNPHRPETQQTTQAQEAARQVDLFGRDNPPAEDLLKPQKSDQSFLADVDWALRYVESIEHAKSVDQIEKVIDDAGRSLSDGEISKDEYEQIRTAAAAAANKL